MTTQLSQIYACPCCGKGEPSSEIEKIHQIVTWIIPEGTMTSGFRCKDYNKKVGGVSNSLHTEGNAIDYAYDSKYEMEWFEIVSILVDKDLVGYVHVNRKGGYVHLQTRGTTQKWTK